MGVTKVCSFKCPECGCINLDSGVLRDNDLLLCRKCGNILRVSIMVLGDETVFFEKSNFKQGGKAFAVRKV